MGWLDRFRRRGPEGAQEAVRWRGGDVVTVHLGRRQFIARARGASKGVLLEGSAVDTLRGARSFLTLQDHAARLAELHGLDDDAARAAYEELVALRDHGLLLEESRAAPSRPVEPSGASIDRLAIMTCDRPHLARRALASVIEAARLHPRPLTVTLHDDAEVPDSDLAREAGPLPEGLSLAVATREDRERFAEALCAEDRDLDPAVVRFILLGDRTLSANSLGANQNSVALDTVGQRHVCMDEDVEARSASADQGGSALGAGHDHTLIEVFADVEAAIAATPANDLEHLAPHDSVLGRKLYDALGPIAGLDVQEATPPLLAAYTEDRGRVVATMTGLMGDSGMGASSYFYLLKGEARARFLSDFEAHRDSRGIRRAVRRLTVSDGTFFMTPHTGFDGRELLPPFFTLGRNTDGLWAQTLRAVSRDALIAYLPRWFVHRPDPRSSTFDMRRASGVTVRLDDLIGLAIGGAQFVPSAEMKEGLEKLGWHLLGLARLPLDELDEWLRLRLWQQKALLRARLLESLEAGGGPPEWERDLEALIDAAEAALIDGGRLVPVDLRRGMAAHRGLQPDEVPAREVQEATRACLARFGAALQAWPRIVAVSGELALRGVHISRPAGKASSL